MCEGGDHAKSCTYNMQSAALQPAGARRGAAVSGSLFCDGGDSDVFLVVYVMMPLY